MAEKQRKSAAKTSFTPETLYYCAITTYDARSCMALAELPHSLKWAALGRWWYILIQWLCYFW